MKRVSASAAGAAALGVLVALLIAAPVPCRAGGVYFVKEGDTLAGISRLFGVDVETIRRTNRLKAAEVRTGDRIRIPDAPPEAKPAPQAARHHEAEPDRLLQTICREEKVYHAVAKGDTLSAVSRRYAVELDELLRLNGLKARSKLSIGQKLLVRRSGPRSHTVARGDTLFGIAERSGIAVEQISRLNGLADDRIAAGQRLILEPCDPYAAAGSAPPPLEAPLAEATPAAAPAPPAAGASQRVIDLARTMLDIPYRFGGTTLRGIDCSAYVQRVFALLDMKIPRTAREQYGIGSWIDREELAIGDLVFFRTYASFPSHVGIYIGDNLFIHASSMVRKVTIDSIDLPYYRKRFLGARRLFSGDEPALAAAP